MKMIVNLKLLNNLMKNLFGDWELDNPHLII